MNSSVRQVTLPAELCGAMEKRFGNLEEFLANVMRELLREDAAILDQNELRIVEERLRELGYL